MKKKNPWIIVLVVLVLIGGVIELIRDDEPKPVVKEETLVVAEPEPVVTEEEPAVVVEDPVGVSIAERLGVTERELAEIENAFRVGGYDYTREDIERIHRLTEDEAMLNPDKFAEYEVTIKDGMTHSITINRQLVDE